MPVDRLRFLINAVRPVGAQLNLAKQVRKRL
jgi:hypothetical protein